MEGGSTRSKAASEETACCYTMKFRTRKNQHDSTPHLHQKKDGISIHISAGYFAPED
jgi:hypothetical protein